MRPLYFILRILLPHAMSIFIRKRLTLNAQKTFKAQTIFVCNHPSAFLDPLVAANYQWPIFFFMTRGDIFKKWLQPVTWASHMVPIYRTEQDGNDSAEKNKDVFVKVRQVLKNKKSLILFAEGYTDNTFIRSLKTIKKGPARIGFGTMESSNWELDIKVQAIGLNYTDPSAFRSDVVVSMGELIYLKDYKALYQENPNKAITELTKTIAKSMQDQLTYIEDKTLADFLEHILILSRKGMNNDHFDKKELLLNRYEYSKKTATYINENYDESDSKWATLKADCLSYFNAQKKQKINEEWVYQYATNSRPNFALSLLLIILTLPITLLGIIHAAIPYLVVKKFIDNTFKRAVFRSGVKLMLGPVITLIYNIPFIFLFYDYIYPSYWLGISYIVIVPAYAGLFAYIIIRRIKEHYAYRLANKNSLAEFAKTRAKLIEKIKDLKLI